MKIGLDRIIAVVFSSVLLLAVGCKSNKQIERSYKDYEKKKIQFVQKKYKFDKNQPPVVQRYYSKNSLFRPKK